MDFFNFNRPAPVRRLNIRSENLILRLSNGPEWVRHPRARELIDELTRSGFFQQEVIQTNTNLRHNYYNRRWQIFEYILMSTLILGISYFYLFIRKDIERFYYVTNRI